MKISKCFLIIFLLTNMTNLSAFTTDIQIGSVKCRGTLIKTKNGLAIITAGHCLSNHQKYNFVNNVYIMNGLSKEVRLIKQVIYSSKEYETNILPNIPSKDDNSSVAQWCRDNHQQDIALILLGAVKYNYLRSLLDADDTTYSPEANPLQVKFKEFQVQDKDFLDYKFTSDYQDQAAIIHGNSGTPLYIDGKIAGVASCYIGSLDGRKKTSYFAAWSKKLQAYLE